MVNDSLPKNRLITDIPWDASACMADKNAE